MQIGPVTGLVFNY